MKKSIYLLLCASFSIFADKITVTNKTEKTVYAGIYYVPYKDEIFVAIKK